MKSPTRERKTNKRQNSTPHDLNPTFLSSIIITTQWFETNLNSNQFVNATIRTSVGVDISMGRRRRRRKRVGGWTGRSTTAPHSNISFLPQLKDKRIRLLVELWKKLLNYLSLFRVISWYFLFSFPHDLFLLSLNWEKIAGWEEW